MNKPVYVVCGWNEDYMDVLGVFLDEQDAYVFEEDQDDYEETRVIESTLVESN